MLRFTEITEEEMEVEAGKNGLCELKDQGKEK